MCHVIMHFFSYNDDSVIVSLLHASMHKRGVSNKSVCLCVSHQRFGQLATPALIVNACFLDGKKLPVACI